MVEITVLKGQKVKHLTSTEFMKEGRKYKIIGCKSTGNGVYDCVDTVKNDQGDYKEFTRKELIEFIER